MPMKPDLYLLNSFSLDGENIEASIILNKEHPVFEGHFPGNPILPGVCTLQIARELIQEAVGKNLMLSRAVNIKYLGFISPVTDPEVVFSIGYKQNDSSITCNIKATAGGNPSCSYKAEYVSI